MSSTTKPLSIRNKISTSMGKKGSGRSRKTGGRITISEIRDRENEAVPKSALVAISQRISESLGELGLRAIIESSEQGLE